MNSSSHKLNRDLVEATFDSKKCAGLCELKNARAKIVVSEMSIWLDRNSGLGSTRIIPFGSTEIVVWAYFRRR